MAEIEKLYVKIDADTSGLDKAMDKATSKVETLQQAYESMHQTSVKDKIAQKFEQTADATEKANSGLRGMMGRLKSITSNIKGGNFKGAAKEIGKMGAALVGVATIAAGIKKAMSTYLSQNEELQNKINGIWYALGSMLAPILTWIVGIAQKLIVYINALVRGLGFAGINMEGMNKSAKSISKSLAGFDELNNIGGSSSSESGLTNPLTDADVNMDWVDKIRENAPYIIGIITSIITAITALKLGASLATSGIILAIGLLVVGFLKHWEQIKAILDKILGYINTAFNWVHENLTSSSNFFLSLIGSVIEFILNLVSTTIQTIKTFLQGLYDGIKQIISGVVMIFKGDLKGGIQTALQGIWTIVKTIFSTIWTFIKGILNSIIGGVENAINTCIKGLNALLTPLRNVGNSILGALGIKTFSFSAIGMVSLPRLATGTNNVPTDMVAMLHQGEAVVPKAFNEEQFNNSLETNELLRQLINVVDTKEFRAYISQNEIGKASVKYINQQSRILGGSLV